MRRLGCLFFILLLAVAVFAADFMVTRYGEEQTAQRVSRSLDADSTVNFSGWPVSVRALLGTIPSATITADEVPLDNGATLDRLEVVLTNVSVNVNEMRGGQGARGFPPADRGRFEAELGEESVAAMLGLPGNVAQVTLVDDVVRIRAAGIDVDANVEAVDGDVVVSLGGPLEELLGGATFPIDISDEPGAPAVEDVEISDGVMILSGVLEDVRR